MLPRNTKYATVVVFMYSLVIEAPSGVVTYPCSQQQERSLRQEDHHQFETNLSY